MQQWNERFPRLAQLHFAQWCYLLATVFLFLYLLLGLNNTVLAQIGAVLLLLATAKEMWQRFAIWWHSLLGKACILIFYAIVLNFSFAYAESIVNGVIGVRPDVVPYSVNLAALLLAPAWTLIGSMLTLQFYSMLHLLKVMLLLMLRPLGVPSKHLLDDEEFPVWTLMARIIYLPVVTMILILTLFSYFSGHPEQFLNWGETTQQQNTPESLQKQLEEIKKREAELQHQQPKGPHSKVPEFQIFIDDGYLMGNSGFKLPTMLWLNKLVASFNYHVESLSASSCKLTPPEHLVHINDYEVLVVTPDATQPVGYSYKVRVCDSPAFPFGVTGRALVPAPLTDQ
ncbi:hypothetical protein [Rheinheimera soli]|uniref:hypothetical protein n=1 Tax=Rheinheimera soli TaxID=443616 RepID=UPI001E3EE8F1|nr:hypothetical protein [Rheinheimera soli]